MNVRVEYHPTPIRHIAVQCPECEKWFVGQHITDDKLVYDNQIFNAQFECPICGEIFGGKFLENGMENLHVEKCSSIHEVYHECYLKKEIWEKGEDNWYERK